MRNKLKAKWGVKNTSKILMIVYVLQDCEKNSSKNLINIFSMTPLSLVKFQYFEIAKINIYVKPQRKHQTFNKFKTFSFRRWSRFLRTLINYRGIKWYLFSLLFVFTAVEFVVLSKVCIKAEISKKTVGTNIKECETSSEENVSISELKWHNSKQNFHHRKLNES